MVSELLASWFVFGSGTVNTGVQCMLLQVFTPSNNRKLHALVKFIRNKLPNSLLVKDKVSDTLIQSWTVSPDLSKIYKQ
jgi:hypothetical protein